MARGIPGRQGFAKRFFTESTPYDLAVAAFGLITGISSAVQAFADNKTGQAWFLAVVTCLIFLITATKLLVIWWTRESKETAHGLESSLHALRAILLLGEEPGEGKDPRLRLTIHVPIDNGKQLEQVLDYVGDQRNPKTSGRRFPAQSGIIGKALREKAAFHARRKNPNHLKYVDELVHEWGYREEDARRLDPATMAWMAIPLTNRENRVEGIVYLDSVDPEFFNTNRVALAGWACVGIARYVAIRYN